MRFITKLRESVGGIGMRRLLQSYDRTIDYLNESIGRLSIELENQGWIKSGIDHEREFSREALERMTKLTVAMAVKNPIVGRSVGVQSDYVFGRGVRFKAKHPQVQAVIDEHISYSKNKECLYDHDAMIRQNSELQTKGNLFFCLFTNPRTGRVVIRDIDMCEVADIIRNPEDYREEWFIKRRWCPEGGQEQVTFHPALGITEESRAMLPPAEAAQGEIDWEAPILHIGAWKFGRMKFGIPEVYPQLDWATAYKRFLEDWASIMRAFSRMAMQITGMTGKKQIGAAKAQMQSTVSPSSPFEQNPSNTTAGFGFFSKGLKAEPVKTAGSTTSAEEGQPILNMAGAAVGLPNFFFGDASVGNHATAKTLDRPTELKMLNRQKLWENIFCKILDYVVFQAGIAPMGILTLAGATKEITVCPFTDDYVTQLKLPNNDDESLGPVDQPINPKVEIKFPELLERNVTDRVRALCNALSMFGKPLTDIVPDKRLVAVWLMDALNIDDPEQYIPLFMTMWEQNMGVEDGKPVKPEIVPPVPPQMGAGGAEDPSQGGDVGNNG